MGSAEKKKPSKAHLGGRSTPSINRRGFGRVAAGIGAGVGAAAMLPGSGVFGSPLERKASPNEKSPAELVTPAAKKVIDKGLSFLVRSQVKTGRMRGAFGNNGMAAGVATASLGGLALMCGGHAPGQGPYGRAIDLCTEYVLNNVRDTGYIATRDGRSCLLYTSPSPRDRG